MFLFSDITEDVRFHGFGESRCSVSAPAPTAWIALGDSPKTTRRRIREHCPAAPGVYGMIGLDKRLIYVGMSKSLRDRLCSYFVGRPVSTKVRRIAMEARHVVWEKTGHEWTAWLRELELIRQWRPRYNARGKPGRTRRSYVCVDRGPGGHVYVSGSPAGADGWTFGPIPAGGRFRQSVRRVNDAFVLRDCRLPRSKLLCSQRGLFARQRTEQCIRGAVGTCSAPCTLHHSKMAYQDRLRSAIAFLQGNDTSILAKLRNKMRSAARSRAYEFAARLRDQHADLERLAAYLLRLREARSYSFVYPALGTENLYLVREGQVRGVKINPGSPPETTELRESLDAIFPNKHAAALMGPEDLDVVLLVSRWFREHPDELDAILLPEDARQRFTKSKVPPY